LRYVYDPAGNLNYRTNNALVQTFKVNNLNELTNITRSGTFTVAGTTSSGATNVTVNTSNAVLYADRSFASTNQTLTNGITTFTAIAKDFLGNLATNAVVANLPQTNVLAYDLNGNLRTNGTEVLIYNDENELVTNFVLASWQSVFVYDGMMRRRIERDYRWDAGTSGWVQTNETRYIYDGNVVLQERDSNNVPTLTLTRGLDLSGSLQGAGGIGGLLAMTESSGASSYFHSDGNGNVTMLLDANQAVVASASYEPFGNFLVLKGPKARVNHYWFSSKPIHWQSGKYDFLLRWYVPDLGRWLNRDPIGENGGINLYGYVGNNPVNLVDLFGLSQQDVNSIFSGYNQATTSMNQAGYRYGFFPPFSSANSDISGRWWNLFYWTPWYNGKGWECYSQSKYLAQQLNSQQYDDQWTIITVTRPDLTHTWVEATSNNPSDPSIRLDPWWGNVSQQPASISSSPSAFPPISNTTVNNIPTVTIPPFSWGRNHP